MKRYSDYALPLPNGFAFTLMRLIIFVLAFIMICFIPPIKAQITIDSLIKLRNTAPLEALVEADKLLYDPSTSDSLVPYLNKEKGYAYQNIKDLNMSIAFLDKAREAFMRKEKWTEVVNIEIQLSNNYAELRQPANAIKYASSAQETAERLNDNQLIIRATENYSFVYYIIGEVDKAIEFLKKSEDYYRENNKSKELSIVYNNLAILYRNKGDYQNALQYDYSALSFNTKVGDEIGVAHSYNNLGNTFLKMKDEDKALLYFSKAAAINDSLNINNSNPLRSLSEIYHHKKDYEKELKLLKEALEVEKKSGSLEAQKKIYQALLKNQLKLQETESAAIYLTQIEEIDIELARLKNQENLQLVEAKQEILENELKWERQKQRTQTYQFIAVSVFLFSLALGVYFYQKQKQKELYLEKQKAQLKNQVLRSQMNPHFIFNALTTIQNTVMKNNPLNAALSISRFAKLIRQYFDFIQKEYITLEEELDALSNYVATQKMRFEDNFNYECKLDLIDEPEEIMIPPLLIEPLVENAIEHGFKGLGETGEIQLEITQEDAQLLVIVVRDNGIGYQPKKDNKLHALDILKERLKFNQPKNKKSFTIEKLEPRGTIVRLNINLKPENL